MERIHGQQHIFDEELEHICEEIGIKRHTKNALICAGITTFAALLRDAELIKATTCTTTTITAAASATARTSIIEQGQQSSSSLQMMKDECRSKILEVINWHTSYTQQYGQSPDILRDFKDEVLEHYKQDIEAKTEFVEHYLTYVLGSKFSKDNVHYLNEMNSRPELLENVVERCIEKVMTPDLVEKCGKFDYCHFITKCVEHFHSLVGCKSAAERCNFVVVGKTQSGKTGVKGVLQSFCGVLKLPLIIITKGVSESKELHAKLSTMAQGTSVSPNHVVVKSGMKKDGKTLGSSATRDRIKEAIVDGGHGGTFIIADTEHQVKSAIKAIQEYRTEKGDLKFILAVDECDAMDRTFDRSQKFEQAYSNLMNLKPSLVVKISATIIPTITLLMDQHETMKLFNLKEADEYHGLDKIQPLVLDGKEVYLEQKGLSVRSVVTYKVNKNGESVSREIPYAHKNVIGLYNDALAGYPHKKGVLLLDCSCPRVHAANNVIEKAESVQRLYKCQKKHIAVMVVIGRGIMVRLPRKGWVEMKKYSLISDAIEDIDETCGLETPLFIFGFSKMRRGVSFRSSRRVPTHFLVALGRGYNCSNVVQTLGRATFNGKSILKENGFSHVTMLTNHQDLRMASKMQEFIEEIYRRIENGCDFYDAVKNEMHDNANFLRHTSRELGLLKGQRHTLLDMTNFGNIIELDKADVITKENIWNDEVAQKIVRTIMNLLDSHLQFDAADVRGAYFDIYEETMKKGALNQTLRIFEDGGLITKCVDAITFTSDKSFLIKFYNKSLAKTEEERSELAR